jgi:putative hydrolase
MNNEWIGVRLRSHANDLERAGANIYRVRAFRRAADLVESSEISLVDLVEERGRAGLEALPGIGQSLAYTLELLVRTGEIHTLRPVQASHDPLGQLLSLPGVGVRLAERLHSRLGVSTVEELEQAVRGGRIDGLGLKPRQLRGLLQALEARMRERRSTAGLPGEPSILLLLEVDAVFREKVEQEEESSILPRRFDPERGGWEPTYRTCREGWRFRVRFFRSALAWRLGQTRDQVVVWFENGTSSGQRTIVTETRGDLEGQRVVRGRERECRLQDRCAVRCPGDPEPAA